MHACHVHAWLACRRPEGPRTLFAHRLLAHLCSCRATHSTRNASQDAFETSASFVYVCSLMASNQRLYTSSPSRARCGQQCMHMACMPGRLHVQCNMASRQTAAHDFRNTHSIRNAPQDAFDTSASAACVSSVSGGLLHATSATSACHADADADAADADARRRKQTQQTQTQTQEDAS